MLRSDVELILREVGAAQHGVALRSQLLVRGIPGSTIDSMVKTGRLCVLRRGVYQVGPLPLPRAAEAAAVLASGRTSRLSHGSAARLHELMDRAVHDLPPEVTVPRRKRPRIEGIRVHRMRDLRPDEVTTLHGIPITTPARTLLDIAETMTAREVEQALAKALRMRLVTLQEMHEMVNRHPKHRGAPLLRQLLGSERGPAFTRSKAEDRLLEIVRAARLPEPVLNTRVLGYEVDFLWTDSRVVVEVDGYAFHGSHASFVGDRQRDAELTAAGYRVLRFTWTDLTEGRFATVVRLAQALVRK